MMYRLHTWVIKDELHQGGWRKGADGPPVEVNK